MGIEKLTDGAVSDGISDGLMGLVGEEHSYAAVQAFDDGDYLGGAAEMLEGAGETVGEFAEDTWESVTDFFGGDD